MFQLSLSSKELFHSNFLGWLCRTYPGQMGNLFASITGSDILPLDKNPTKLNVYREHKNIDLWITYPSGEQLIVENKVKSLPHLPQLQNYAKEVQSKAKTAFLLLSLTRPDHLLSDGDVIRLLKNGEEVTWKYASYRQLADGLAACLPEIANANVYHGQMLKDYIGFIINLDSLYRQILSELRERENFWDSEEDFLDLKELRLHDLIDKLRYAELARCIEEELKGKGFSVTENRPAKEGDIWTGSAMTRSVGLFDLKYCLMGPEVLGQAVMAGVQIQGNAFRLFSEIADKKWGRKVAAALWNQAEEHKIWFDFKPLQGVLGAAVSGIEYPQDSRSAGASKVFNTYGDTFLYRSRKITQASFKDLVQSILHYAELLREQAPMLRAQIKSVL